MERVVQTFEPSKAAGLILKRVVEEQAARGSAPPVLSGISGRDCSGKSTLARELLRLAKAEGIVAELVPVDDFIIPRPQRKRGGPSHVDYFENTFDHAGFTDRVGALRDAGDSELIIGEGVFLFRQELAAMWTLKVWIEMPAEESVERGAVRDAEYFGSAENARSEYLRRFVTVHEYHLERDRPVDHADFVFEVRG